MKKVLYISDLDGTLLRSDETISKTTASIINKLVNNGLLFSYATARSLVTSKHVTKGIEANIPVIVYNGTFIMDYQSGEILIANYFEDKVKDTILEITHHNIYPIVYSYIDGKEYFSYIKTKVNKGMRKFLDTRKKDPRVREVDTIHELLEGQIFYINYISDKEKLDSLFEKYQQRYHCIYDQDLYSKEQWLEILPNHASKATALKQLKEYLGCDYVIAFGDGKNDIEMFELADECYAMENACEELKKIATAIIGNNNEDSVARFIREKNSD